MTRSSDESAVRTLYQQLMDGWNQGSGETFAAPFAEGGDFIAFDGTHFKGRQKIAQFHQPLFETHLKGTRLVGEVTDVRFLSPDVALMHAAGGTVMRGKSAPSPERDSIQTLVAMRDGGEWRLAAFQNTRTRPIGRNAAETFVWILSDWLWKLFRRVGPLSISGSAERLCEARNGKPGHGASPLRGIANKPRADKQHRFRNLYRCLDAELLLDRWTALSYWWVADYTDKPMVFATGIYRDGLRRIEGQWKIVHRVQAQDSSEFRG